MVTCSIILQTCMLLHVSLSLDLLSKRHVHGYPEVLQELEKAYNLVQNEVLFEDAGVVVVTRRRKTLTHHIDPAMQDPLPDTKTHQGLQLSVQTNTGIVVRLR